MAQAQLLRAVSARAAFLAAAAATGGLIALATPLLAQATEGIDVARLRARASAEAGEAETFARAVARRGKAVAREAQETAASARRSARRAASAPLASGETAGFDFDAMVSAAATAPDPENAPRLIGFASLSMPADALRRMIADIGRAGGAVVFRGFPGGSARTFTAALAKVLPEGRVQPGVGIDPRLFRAFGIDTVPAYVVTAGPVDLCDGFACRSTPPPFDIVRGNVTLGYALELFARGGGPGAGAAVAFGRRLEQSR